MAQSNMKQNVVFSDPPFATALFGDPRWAWLWLLPRLYIGYTWLTSGWGKLTNPAWVSGKALQGFWQNAVAIPEAPARPAIAFDWYRSFIQGMLDSGAYIWFAKVIMVAEIAIGIALILGIFTGIAAFFGGFMNWNFMMAGSASINPFMFLITIFLILAWKTAGWLGLDHWVLPLLGTPWGAGKLFGRSRSDVKTT